MRLPEPLRRLRSGLAHGIGLFLRSISFFTLRMGRFYWECLARAQIRGHVAPGVQFIGPIYVDGEAKIYIGPGARIGRRVVLETYNGAEIHIGPRVTINDGTIICAYYGIRIAEASLIGEYVSIRDANHSTRANEEVAKQPHIGEPIYIGQDCWIARGAIVLHGVHIGNGAVVGANSVVNKDIEPRVIVAGAPARPIGKRSGTDANSTETH
jgi:acetyltransferase-like isoleucine patch superfamily enzyme